MGGNVTIDPGNGSDLTVSSPINLPFSQQVNAGVNRIDFGNSSSNMILGTSQQFTGQNTNITAAFSNPYARILYALGDNGTARNLTFSLTGLFELTREATAGVRTGTVTLQRRAHVSISNMNQLFTGNLNLNGAVLILDGVSWGDFLANRSGGYGTGANQWQLNVASAAFGYGGGFGARGEDLVISGIGSTIFDRDATFGSSFLNDQQLVQADASVTLAQDTVLTGARTWQFGGGLIDPSEFNNIAVSKANFQNFNLNNLVIHQITGQITGNQDLNLSGIDFINGRNMGFVRLTNEDNEIANMQIGPLASRTVVIATDVDVLGSGTITLGNTTSVGSGSMLLWENTTGSPKTFDRDIVFNAVHSNGGTLAIGSFAGDTVYTGTMTLNGGVGTPETHQFFAQSGSTLQLGDGTNQAITDYARPAGRQLVITKGGSGTTILENVGYTFTNVPSSTIWQIGTGTQNGINNTVAAPYFDGAVRETGTSGSNSLTDYFIRLAGGVLETNGDFTRSLGTAGNTSVGWSTGGGGFSAHGAPLFVNIGGVSTSYIWASSANFVTADNPLIFGSETANNVVTFENGISLNGAVREIRVIDNPDSSADRAVISGSLTGAGGSAGIQKTGAGILELIGTHTYTGQTIVSAGTLLVNASLTGSGAVTVAVGATLGGEGTIAGATTVNGILAPGNSPGLLTFSSDVTLTSTSTSVFEITGITRGTEYDAVNVANQLTYGGLGQADIQFTLVPATTYDFDLWDFSSIDGTYSSFQVTGLYTTVLNASNTWTALDGDGNTWNFNHTTGVLSVSVIPEPGTSLLLVLAGLAFLVSRKTRRFSARQ